MSMFGAILAIWPEILLIPSGMYPGDSIVETLLTLKLARITIAFL